MQSQARLPEIFDQIPHCIPEVEYGSTLPPPPRLKFSQILGLWVLTFHFTPPIQTLTFSVSSDLTYFTSSPGIQTLTFSSEFKSDLFHITPPPKIPTLTFSSEFRSDLFHITPRP